MVSLKCGIKKINKWTHIQNRDIPTDIENKLMINKGDRGIN